MKVKENQVYSVAMQFCRNFNTDLPEIVIYGYAKLLTMDEKQVRSILPEDCMGDLEIAHKWFADRRLDLNVIKSGLLIVVPVIPEIEIVREQKEFSEYLETEVDSVSSGDILQQAFEIATVQFNEVFVEGKNLNDVFEYQSAMKKTFLVKKEQLELRGLGTLSKKYRELTVALLDVVKGQEQAVAKFVQGYNQGELLKRTEKGNHPKSYFFFFGPPGVGKTLLAETAADVLGIPHKLFNMSEYASPGAVEDLIGLAEMYGGGSEGSLVKFVRENPECLLIFDEIEKAHMNVIRLFLQILGSGKIRNSKYDKDADFSNTTIIFTSNLGSDL